MKSKLWLVTVVMIAALVLSACGTTALSGTLSAAPALNPAPASSAPTASKSTAALGSLLFRRYLLPFEIVSVLLLAAMVGAILLSRRKLK